MVEKIDGRGRHYRDVLQELGRKPTDYSTARFYSNRRLDAIRLEVILERIVRSGPVSEDSLFIENVVDTTDRRLAVVSFPQGAIEIPDRYKDNPGLPNANETYVVEVRTHRLGTEEEVLVLVNDPKSAIRIAMRKLGEQGWDRRDMQAKARVISAEEFVERVKKKIDGGDSVPEMFLRFAGLRKYANERRSRLVQVPEDAEVGLSCNQD